jgi:hypothetical protein
MIAYSWHVCCVDGVEDLDQLCKLLKQKWKEIEGFRPTKRFQGKGVETME